MALFLAGLITSGVVSVGYIATRAAVGGCTRVETQQDFNIDNYAGTWYEF